MNSPGTVTNFINVGHFIDHYAMLVFAAAVLVMAPAWNLSYGELLPYATPGFFVFGAGALIAGWIGDLWSRRHMMVVFFLGTGLSTVSVGLVQTPMQLGVTLFAVGLFASIYHPIGTAMLLSYTGKLGRQLGINGVWGNMGVALSAVITGVICENLGWRWAFIIPGLITVTVGLLFMVCVYHEEQTDIAPISVDTRVDKDQIWRSSTRVSTDTGDTRVGKDQMWRAVLALVVTVIANSTTYLAVTIALPKLFTERLGSITTSPVLIGFIAAGVYACGAVTQYSLGSLIDRYSLKTVLLLFAVAFPPLLYFSAGLSGIPFLLIAAGMIVGLFGMVTVNDAIVGKYTSDKWRARAYAVRYFLGFATSGVSIGVVAWVHEKGGFDLTLRWLSAFSIILLLGTLIFPSESNRAGSIAALQIAGRPGTRPN